MEFQNALLIIEKLLAPKSLNKIERLIFQYSWDGWSYSKIAIAINYDEGYVKDVGASLWKMLSKLLGQKVTKNNLQLLINLHLTTTEEPKKVQILIINNERFSYVMKIKEMTIVYLQ